MPRSIDQRAEEILSSLPAHVAKTFKPKEYPSIHLARELLHAPDRGLRMERCYPLRSGVHVCEDPNGKYAAMYYCSNWKGRSPSGQRLGPYDPEAYGRRGCKKELKIMYFNRSAYIDWISTSPERRGHGMAFWKEIRNFLEKKKCVKRVTLHSLHEAEGFYECGPGFVPLKTSYYKGTWTMPRCQRGKSAGSMRPEDKAWSYKYSYKPYEFILHPDENCKPTGPEPETQTRLHRYGSTHYSDETTDEDYL